MNNVVSCSMLYIGGGVTNKKVAKRGQEARPCGRTHDNVAEVEGRG